MTIQSDLFPGDQRVRPSQTGMVVTHGADGNVQVLHMQWGLRPKPGERPWTNIRAEGKSFAEGRCLVVAGEYYIHRKEQPNRGRWCVTWPGEPDFCFAGIWHPAAADWPASYAIITCAAGPDLAPYEDRQAVFIAKSRWRDWLEGHVPEEELLRPLPFGSLKISPLRRPV
jgi:putative SOS response-associated peptidase YedK